MCSRGCCTGQADWGRKETHTPWQDRNGRKKVGMHSLFASDRRGERVMRKIP